MVLLRHITAPSPAYAVHYYSAVYRSLNASKAKKASDCTPKSAEYPTQCGREAA